ncbi:methyl-accepting chemotaxis protein [Vibrio sp. MA40-2]|uniref:methyl-accepting chemotaxis protein n=1 Tax=Vibrio sp. MA40-2 TaxID=3391828 RepID=UPI0039A6478D
MKIKHKLIGLTTFSFLALIVVVTITEISNLKLIKLEKTLIEVKSLEISLLDLNRLELEFLNEHNTSILDEFSQEYEHFQDMFSHLNNRLDELDIIVKELPKLSREIIQYDKDFHKLVRTFGDDNTQDHAIQAEMKLLFEDIFSIFHKVEAQMDNEMERTQNDIETFIFISLIVVGAVLTSLSYFIIRNIQSSILQLSQVMSVVSQNHDLTIRANVESNDEIADIGKQLNAVFISLQKLIIQVQGSIHQLGSVSTQLQNCSRDTQQSLNQQLLETDSVATAVTEMGETIKEVAATTENAATNTQKSYEIAQLGLSEIENTRNVISGLSTDLHTASNEVDQLSTLSEQISSVLEVIVGIAEQTNLLALNAAIEAARAGEQGRGFAVVADEVRTLASRTQNSTEEISTIIDSVQEQTKTVVSTMKRCSGNGEKSVESSNSAYQKIQEIMNEMQHILDNSTQISSAVEEQSQVSGEISRNVNNIRDLTSINVQSVTNNTQSASIVAVQSDELASAIDKFKA